MPRARAFRRPGWASRASRTPEVFGQHPVPGAVEMAGISSSSAPLALEGVPHPRIATVPSSAQAAIFPANDRTRAVLACHKQPGTEFTPAMTSGPEFCEKSFLEKAAEFLRDANAAVAVERGEHRHAGRADLADRRRVRWRDTAVTQAVNLRAPPAFANPSGPRDSVNASPWSTWNRNGRRRRNRGSHRRPGGPHRGCSRFADIRRARSRRRARPLAAWPVRGNPSAPEQAISRWALTKQSAPPAGRSPRPRARVREPFRRRRSGAFHAQLVQRARPAPKLAGLSRGIVARPSCLVTLQPACGRLSVGLLGGVGSGLPTA